MRTYNCEVEGCPVLVYRDKDQCPNCRSDGSEIAQAPPQ